MTPKSAPRAYSYLRFSTPEQRKGDSLRRQTALADEYARRHGLALDTELSLRDLGVSAFRGDNAALGALGAFRRAVSDGLVPKGSFLLVENLDRISRDKAHKAVRILEEIVEAGVTVVTLNDGKQWTEASLDGADFLLAILLFMRGNEESDTKSKRLKAAWVGKRERAANGEIQTIRVPAWIRADGSGAKDSRNAKLSLIVERADLIRRMFKMFLAGTGKKAIAETFNRERIPTWGAGKGRAPAAYWHQTYVFKILTSPTVTGRFVPHLERHEGKFIREPQKPIEGYYPRVVDDETFQRVQSLCASRRQSVRSGHVASIVAGLARCPKCDSTMTRVFKGAAERAGAPKLVCVKAKAGAGCTYHGVKLPDVERAFIENAAQFRKPPIAQSTLAMDIDATDEELYLVHKQIEALVDAIERKPSAALSKRLAEREAQAAALKAALDQLRERAAESESGLVALRAKRLADAVAGLKPDTLAAANAALRECMESVVVDYPEGVLRLAWRHGPTTELRFDAGTHWKNLGAAET
jgi:DNA invertase Pin-like site-specific DNA recombinase